MGSSNNRTRSQIRVQKQTSLAGNKKNFSSNEKLGYFSPRNKYFKRKKCYRTSFRTSLSFRFLQHIFCSSKKEWQTETNHKSETSQQISRKETFQNGHIIKSNEFSEARRLGHKHRSDRCVFTCPNISRTSKISKISCSRPSLSVQSHVLRTNVRPKSIYKDCIGGSGILEGKKHKIDCISGRLVHNEPEQKTIDYRSRTMSQSPSYTGFHSKQRKIKSVTQPELDLFRGTIQSEKRPSLSNRRKTSQITYCNSEIGEQFFSDSFRFSSSSWSNGVMLTSNTKCSFVHETYSTSSPCLLETNLSRFESQSTCYTTSAISSRLVEKFSEHAERPIFSTTANECNHNNRCFQVRFWGVYGQKVLSGDMVSIGNEKTYQCFGNGGSDKNCETFPEPPEGSNSTCTIRQYNCSPVYQQARGDKISTAVLPNLGIMESSPSAQYYSKSSSHQWQDKLYSRQIEQVQNSTDRMVSQQGGCSMSVSKMGSSTDRLICVSGESPDRDLLLLDTESTSFCSRCNDNIMGKDVCICIPPNLFDSENFTLYEAVPVSDPINCPIMASETLVPGTPSVIDRLPSQVANTTGSAVSTEGSILPPRSGSFQPDCMASIDQSFQTEGFSKEARELLSASWRKGTRKDYSSKFKKYYSWCNSREIDPNNATISQVADFLVSLFESGLQYRTIAGYRSMISNILPHVDNVPVGQHPHICRLLKGVFNTRPPSTKLIPEWDLQLVLDVLQKHPFEPLENIDLKHLTFKTVFLISITTFRRCSDLQSLRVNDSLMRIQQKGITFIRCGLAKQDRPNHVNSKIFVPSFKDNVKLDPLRCLLQYIEKTKTFRKSLGKEQQGKLFLSLCEPHNPVTSQTISNWIVSTIKLAYPDKTLENVKGHSTRAIGPSWALFKGASLHTIMEAADWTSKSTFGKFYLRDLSVDLLDNCK